MLMKDVLGDYWQQLPSIIQQHYDLDENQTICLNGVMTVAYPHWMLPIVWWIHLFGGLVLWRGVATTQVRKTLRAGVLHWQRSMVYQENKSDYFSSKMMMINSHEVIEIVGFGFGLRLQVTVEHGDLVYRSNGHFWQLGKFHFMIPDNLLLGSATIIEHALSNEEFYLDFTIRHPWWGETYSYRGVFS